MRNRISHCFQLRRTRMSWKTCYSMAGLPNLWPAVVSVAKWTTVLVATLYLLSDVANAHSKKTEIESHLETIAELSKLLAACLGEKEGVLWIGNEAFLCKAISTGIRR